MVTQAQAEAAAPIAAAIDLINANIAKINAVIAANDYITAANLTLASTGSVQSAAPLSVADTQTLCSTLITIMQNRVTALQNQLAAI